MPRRFTPAQRCVLTVAALLALTGCSADQPEPAPSTIGTQAEVCAARVDTVKADAVIDQPVAELHELNTFTADSRAGECALVAADGGALLSVAVVHDVKGTKLSAELELLSTQENYSGTDTSGVTGEGITTTALVAIDAAYYVRVMGLGGTSDEQRSSALALAEDVAARTKPIK